MANIRVIERSGRYAPTAGATTNLARWVPPRPGAGMTVNGLRLIAFSCRVVTAGNGTGTVSFGSTTGGVASIMAAADVGETVLGRKLTPTGADLAGNGVARAPGLAEEFITGTYVVGTDTINPVIIWKAIFAEEEDVVQKRLLVL